MLIENTDASKSTTAKAILAKDALIEQATTNLPATRAAAATPSLASLAPKLDVYLSKLLPDVTATCLALTCKKLYAAYKTARFGKPLVPLHAQIFVKNGRGIAEMVYHYYLGDLLRSWASIHGKLYYWPAGNEWVLRNVETSRK
jgi:hypothetical protein